MGNIWDTCNLVRCSTENLEISKILGKEAGVPMIWPYTPHTAKGHWGSFYSLWWLQMFVVCHSGMKIPAGSMFGGFLLFWGNAEKMIPELRIFALLWPSEVVILVEGRNLEVDRVVYPMIFRGFNMFQLSFWWCKISQPSAHPQYQIFTQKTPFFWGFDALFRPIRKAWQISWWWKTLWIIRSVRFWLQDYRCPGGFSTEDGAMGTKGVCSE